MLVSGGKILSIDRVKTDSTVSGDGVSNKLGIADWIRTKMGVDFAPDTGTYLFGTEGPEREWLAVSAEDWGTYQLDESGATVTDEQGNPQYAEENENLWTKLRSKEFGARRSIADRFGRIIDKTYTTSSNVENLIEIHAHDNDMTNEDLNDLLDILGQ